MDRLPYFLTHGALLVHFTCGGSTIKIKAHQNVKMVKEPGSLKKQKIFFVNKQIIKMICLDILQQCHSFKSFFIQDNDWDQ